MKTKNMKDKSAIVPAEITKKNTSSSSAAKAPQVTKPPVFALEGTKWRIEYQVNNKNIVIDNPETKHTVYIFNCKGSTIQIKGKVNTITVDNCEKTAVVFENAIASFEVVNCRSLEVQVIGKVPAIAIDKTSGIQLYLSKDSLESEIITSKSDQMNVLIPGPDQDMEEKNIPEQYKTTIKNGQLVTEVVAHV